MPALFTRDTNTPTTMSGQSSFQSLNATATATASGQENQPHETQQHKQVLEKKAAADKKYVWAKERCCDTKTATWKKPKCRIQTKDSRRIES